MEAGKTPVSQRTSFLLTAVMMVVFSPVFGISIDRQQIDLEIEQLERQETKSVVFQNCPLNGRIPTWCTEGVHTDPLGTVEHGIVCHFGDGTGAGAMDLYSCDDGKWESEVEAPRHEVKRGHSACSRSGRWIRGRRARCRKVNHAPYYVVTDNCPPPTTTFYTPASSNYGTFSWPDPVATDLEDGIIRSTKGTKSGSGDTFQGASNGYTHQVSYYARDRVGVTGHCIFNINVIIRTCPTPTTPTHGNVACPSGIRYGDTCTYSCSTGFTPTHTSVYCKSDSTWSGSTECVPVECSHDLLPIEDGFYECSQYTYGSSCQPQCNPDLDLEGNFPITCAGNGEWERAAIPICKDRNPPTLTGCPSSIHVIAQRRSSSEVVTWSAPVGNDPEDGDNVLVSQTTGGITSGASVSAGTTYTITYIAIDTKGNPSEECVFNVSVSAITCPATAAIDNGFYECDLGSIYGSQCTFVCLGGYELQGSSQSECLSDATWTSQTPACTAMTCSSPGQAGLAVANGDFSCPSPLNIGTVCTSSCDLDFRQETVSTAACSLQNGQATFEVVGSLECIDAIPPVFDDCTSPKSIILEAERGTTSAPALWTPPSASDNNDAAPIVNQVSGVSAGDMLQDGSIAVVEFQAIDSDNNPSEICTYYLEVTVIECNPLVPGAGSVITCDKGNIYGSTCSPTCLTGYEVDGDLSAECLHDTTWSSSLACKEVICDAPPTDPANGAYTCPSPYLYNTLCEPSCDPGFDLEQGSVARCTQDKSWAISQAAVCSDGERPVIVDCVASVTLQAGPGEEDVLVDVTPPTATDNVDVNVNVTQISGPVNGERISEDAIMMFQAFDDQGNPSDTCITQLTVEVLTCPLLPFPSNGQYTCTSANIYGSECTYTCNLGYVIANHNSITCTNTETWSETAPSCTPVTCQDPETRNYGRFDCQAQPTEYGDRCILVCDDGFSSDVIYATCEADTTWAYSSNDHCVDTTPPVLGNCSTYQTFYADRGTNSTAVTWTPPTVIDNVEGAYLVQLSNQTSGSVLEIGEHFVEYQGVDLAGNPSQTVCTITLNVEEVVCLNPRVTFTDVNLEFTCPDYTFGATCDVSCKNSSSSVYSLVGPDNITCEHISYYSGKTIQYWDFSGNVQPSCEEIIQDVCLKDLPVPQNGAIAYVNDPQPLALVTCHDDWDLSYGFDGQVFCLTDGSWNPSRDSIGDCTFPRFPGLDFLNASYHYSGDCSSASTEAEIKDLVLAVMQDFRGTAYAPDCLSTSDCDYSDVIVDCGLNRRKKKSVTGNVVVTIRSQMFGVLSTTTEFVSAYTQLTGMADALLVGINAGVFDIPGYETLNETFAKSITVPLKCSEEGTLLQGGLKCKPCAVGMYLYKDPTSGTQSCRECPIGFYMDHDAATACVPCPVGTSTNSTRAKSADSCLSLCPTGHFSPNGLIPCSACPLGTYQTATGQTECSDCPSQQTTYKTGSLQCTDYDVILDAGSYELTLHNLTSAMTSYSIMIWYKLELGSSLVMSASDGTSGNDIWTLNLGLTSTFSIHGSSQTFDSPVSKWIHLAITFDSTVNIYVGDVAAASDVAGSVALPQYTLVKFTVDSASDIRLSGYGLYATAVTSDVIQDSMTSCHSDMTSANPVYSSDDLIGLYATVPEIFAEPSECVAVDPCLSSPCGVHACIQNGPDYTCVCRHGYTGVLCQTPPDYCAANECRNGGSCVNTATNYTCQCPSGYSGAHCQNAPIAGGFNSWSSWTSCTSCDVGTKQRSRQCNNPAPGPNGADCVGSLVEEASCITQGCAAPNACDSNPCGSGGTCQVHGTGFRCLCHAGMTGSQCQTEVDFCSGSPCLNGGTCSSQTVGFTCACPVGFNGSLCEAETVDSTYVGPWSPCTVSCGVGISTRTHYCAFTATSSCQADVEETRECNTQECPGNHCDPTPCGSGSSCISTANGFLCICPEGYTGTTCTQLIDRCAGNVCIHGDCESTSTGYICTCADGYTGLYCDSPAVDGQWGNWYLDSPCSVTCGTGVLTRARYCNNPAPLGGNDCQGDSVQSEPCTIVCSDNCSPNPCMKGQCRHNDSSPIGYSCHCIEGYTGLTCNIPPDPCQPNPCANGGICSNSGTNFVCSCPNGYSGDTCTIAPDPSVWVTWGSWEGCSTNKSCEPGIRQRRRACAMGASGLICEGEAVDTEQCNTEECPVCPPLPVRRSIGTIVTRVTSDDNITYTFSCTAGRFMANMTAIRADDPTYVPVYTCGPDTGYVWNNTRPVPSCSSGRTPRRVTLAFNMDVSPRVPCSQSERVSAAYGTMLDGSTCSRMANCAYRITAGDCSGNIGKRQSDTSNLNFVFEVDLETNATGVAAEDLLTATKEEVMESTELIKSGTTAELTQTADGVTYSVDTNTITWQSGFECEPGYIIEDDYLCVGCAAGTMYDSSTGLCEYCPVGTYQELQGQFVCLSCPQDLTHSLIGSFNASDCTDPVSYESSGSSDSSVTVIAAAVGGVTGALVIAVLAIGGYFLKKQYMRKSNVIKVESTEVRQLDNVWKQKFDNSSLYRGGTSHSILSKSDVHIEDM